MMRESRVQARFSDEAQPSKIRDRESGLNPTIPKSNIVFILREKKTKKQISINFLITIVIMS